MPIVMTLVQVNSAVIFCGIDIFSSVGCHTESEAPCIFPFHFNGTEYSQCTGDGSLEEGKTWCAIKVAFMFLKIYFI